jgi:hypothetical protein
MHAMLGARAFSLAANRASGSVYCGPDGVFVGSVPLLQCSGAVGAWSVRPIAKLNDELSSHYRLPIDIAAKANALALIAHALNRGDLAIAAIATVQMQLPDPPLTKVAEAHHQAAHRAAELQRLGLLKLWDPAEHPRTGVPPNPGWFASIDAAGYGAPSAEAASQAPPVREAVKAPREGNPKDTFDLPTVGGGGGGTPRLFGPGGLFGEPAPYDGGPDVIRPSPEGPFPVPREVSPRPAAPAEAQPELPFPGGLPPKLAPYSGGKTSGILELPDGKTVTLQSGYDGPAKAMPGGSPGFDTITKGHVEGHAAAIMRQDDLSEGTLRINNPEICENCAELLPRMLPPGARLRVILPDGTVTEFEGLSR